MSKKQSLFKQKLKQAKLNNPQKQANIQESYATLTFPKVFKLQDFNQQVKSCKISHSKIQQQSPYKSSLSRVKQEDQYLSEASYLQKNKENFENFMSNEQMHQIDMENWKAVDSMSEQQRNNYINLIQNTFSKHFIEKIKKKSIGKQAPKISQKSEKIKNASQMIPEMLESKFQTQYKQKQQISESAMKQSEEKIQNQDDSQSHNNIIENIYLNIKSGKLRYFSQQMLLTLSEQQKNDFVNKSKIFEMIRSENNQSQIIGSQLALGWLKFIFPCQNLIYTIQNVPFHTRIILSQMLKLLNGIQMNIKNTRFYSCYIQMLVKSVQILTLIYKQLSENQLKSQIKFIENEFEKAQKSLKAFLSQSIHNQQQTQQNIQQYQNQKQQKQMIFESLGILFECLKQEREKRKESNQASNKMYNNRDEFQKMKSKNRIKDMIQAMLIEQTLKQQEFQIYELTPTINIILRNLTEFWQFNIQGRGDIKNIKNSKSIEQNLSNLRQFYNFLYQFVCSLNNKLRGHYFYKKLIKEIFINFLQQLEQNYLKAVYLELINNQNLKISTTQVTQAKQTKYIIIYQILYVYKQLSRDTQKLTVFLQNLKSNQQISQQQLSIVVYINLQHYLQAQDLNNQDISLLQKMLTYQTHQIMKNIIINNSQQKHLDSSQVLLSFLGLFLSSDQEIYSLIDQNILNDVFSQAIKFYQLTQKKQRSQIKGKACSQNMLLSQIQIKKMVQNYNYNSFGNDIFTKVIFWVATQYNQEIQSLIAEQVMMRYPMLFYYASEPIQSAKSPLLGNLNYYIKTNPNKKQEWFSYESNPNIKANLLKLLLMNLEIDLENAPQKQIFNKILNKQDAQQRKGFTITKNMLNKDNYFYKYLIQPFLKQWQYEQLF